MPKTWEVKVQHLTGVTILPVRGRGATSPPPPFIVCSWWLVNEYVLLTTRTGQGGEGLVNSAVERPKQLTLEPPYVQCLVMCDIFAVD